MRSTACTLLSASLLLSVSPSVVTHAAPLEAASYEAALATGRAYAADRTLIFYCLRASYPKNAPALYVWLHDDLEQAMQRLKAAGGDPGQNEGLAQAVLANTRSFAADARDTALEAQCKAQDVENSLALLRGVARPLFLRPPFDKFPH